MKKFSLLAEDNAETKLHVGDYLDKKLDEITKYRLLTNHFILSETFQFPSNFKMNALGR